MNTRTDEHYQESGLAEGRGGGDAQGAAVEVGSSARIAAARVQVDRALLGALVVLAEPQLH
ncbi:hypothetical protein ACIRPT_12220 [Streptomyces sp. NPDC101227]|uniref:hypothetical protein n=1 Tax=Streptomyces sp. NPDC101227 TaxID=3366136 RepID=UPI003825C9B4